MPMSVSFINANGNDVVNNYITLTHGFSINSGDVLLAIISVNGSGKTITDDNGANAFTEEITNDHPIKTATYWVGYRRCGGSEPSDYSWDMGGGFTSMSSCILQFRNVVGSGSPWDVAPVHADFNFGEAPGNQPDADAITINSNGAMSIALLLCDGHPSITDYPSGYTSRYETGGTAWMIQAGTKAQSGSPPFSQEAIEWVYGGVQDWSVIQFSLKPAPAVEEVSTTFDVINIVSPVRQIETQVNSSLNNVFQFAPVGTVAKYSDLSLQQILDISSVADFLIAVALVFNSIQSLVLTGQISIALAISDRRGVLLGAEVRLLYISSEDRVVEILLPEE